MTAPARSRIMTTSVGTNQQAFTVRDWGLFAGLSLIWGASFLLMDIGLEAFTPGLVTWIRVGTGAAVLLAVPRARNRIAREDWPRLVVLSFTWVAIPFTLFPLAQQWISSAVAGMLNGGMPIFTVVIAALMLRRRPGFMQALGVAIGFLGVVLISLPELGEGSTQALGAILVIIAVLGYAFSTNIATPLQQKYGSLTLMAHMLGLAALWTAPLGIVGVARSSFAWPSLIAVLIAGIVGTGIAYAMVGTLVGSVGATRASFVTYAIPVVALILGVTFRGDHVTSIALVGVALITGGALLASRKEA